MSNGPTPASCAFATNFPTRRSSRIPNAPEAVRMLADEVCSTEKMVTYCKQSPAKAIIIATEAGMLHRLEKECPDKHSFPAPTDNCRCNECRFMKMNTLEKALRLHGQLAPRVELSRNHRARAFADRPHAGDFGPAGHLSAAPSPALASAATKP